MLISTNSIGYWSVYSSHGLATIVSNYQNIEYLLIGIDNFLTVF